MLRGPCCLQRDLVLLSPRGWSAAGQGCCKCSPTKLQAVPAGCDLSALTEGCSAGGAALRSARLHALRSGCCVWGEERDSQRGCAPAASHALLRMDPLLWPAGTAVSPGATRVQPQRLSRARHVALHLLRWRWSSPGPRVPDQPEDSISAKRCKNDLMEGTNQGIQERLLTKG